MSRGDGTTTSQIEYAPRDAIFVWCNVQSVWYARELTRVLSRADITVCNPETWFCTWRGTTRKVVFDHALDKGTLRREEYDYYSRWAEKASSSST